jgi:hypothetical protein
MVVNCQAPSWTLCISDDIRMGDRILTLYTSNGGALVKIRLMHQVWYHSQFSFATCDHHCLHHNDGPCNHLGLQRLREPNVEFCFDPTMNQFVLVPGKGFAYQLNYYPRSWLSHDDNQLVFATAHDFPQKVQRDLSASVLFPHPHPQIFQPTLFLHLYPALEQFPKELVHLLTTFVF